MWRWLISPGKAEEKRDGVRQPRINATRFNGNTSTHTHDSKKEVAGDYAFVATHNVGMLACW